tara:strand:- start:591 stop:815 length:225 start_codon:yes stop_codon:yes gene_type:complete
MKNGAIFASGFRSLDQSDVVHPKNLGDDSIDVLRAESLRFQIEIIPNNHLRAECDSGAQKHLVKTLATGGHVKA